jgi:PIN domain nuclease of toxin-antitoxin system
MRLLLDTNAFLWMALGSQDLSPTAGRAIADGGNEKRLSVVSLWEIAIKTGIGKLELREPFADFLARVNTMRMLERVPVADAHLLAYAALPMHHRDPFDRMLVAQALSEDFTLVSSDPALDAYGVRRLW